MPPQLWAWAGWRVKKMRRSVDAVLTALPFEEEWYRSRGVTTHYVGHPYFDDLAAQRTDADFIDGERRDPRPVVAILPGSRNQEVAGNMPLMIEAAKRIMPRSRRRVSWLRRLKNRKPLRSAKC